MMSNKRKKISEAYKIIDGKGKNGDCPDLWDGRTAGRIVEVFRDKI